MSEPRNHDELLAEVRLLADGYVDGSLDEAQQTRLRELIAHDHEARELYITYAHETFDLVQATRAIAAKDEALANQPAVTGMMAPLRAIPLASRRTIISTAAAAVVVGVFLATMAYITVPIYRAMMGSTSDGSQPSREIVAQLTASRKAVWADGQIGRHDGAYLPVGHRMELKQGQATVTHRNGAVVTLDGPCVYVVQDFDMGMLEVGRLVATVPPTAIGFRVVSAAATITDLGTQFGVDVTDLGNVHVHVIAGRVCAAPNVGTPRELVELVAGQSLRYDGQWHLFATSAAEQKRLHALARATDIQVVSEVKIYDVSSELTVQPFDRRAAHLVDGSGTFRAGHSSFPDAPSGGSIEGNMWLTHGAFTEPHDPLPAQITFDLGAIYELTGIHVWNYNEQIHALHSRGAREVDISVSATLDPPQFVELQTSEGGFLFPRADGTGSDRGFFIDLEAIPDPAPLGRVRLIRFDIQSNHSPDSVDQCTGLSEVRFFGRVSRARDDQQSREVRQQRVP